MIKALNEIFLKGSLSREEASRVMNLLAEGDVSFAQVGALMGTLRFKGESVDEITGFAEALRGLAVRVETPPEGFYPALVDVCGTGGDSLGTFNVSTAVAFTVASCDVKVAKHGNRAVSSKSGSFDVLEALKLKPTRPGEIWTSLNKFNLAFLYAPDFHPVLKKLGEFRRSLGVHTVFNLLGPLLNPLPVKYQVVGVYDQKALEKMAEVMGALGSKEVMVVRGHDGLDELSLSGPSDVAHLKDGIIKKYVLSPEDAGLSRAPLSSVLGGDALDNAHIIENVLRGKPGPQTDLVLLNAAAALLVTGKVRDMGEGVDFAKANLNSGKAFALLEKMRGDL